VTVDVDRRAMFESVVDEVYEPLQRYLRRRASAEDADEVLDDVLLTVWCRLRDVPTHAALPWCYAVARRALANKRRANGRYKRLLEALAAQPPPPSLLDRDGAAGNPDLADAFGRLSEADREVLRLWAWEELEPREIALVLDSTPNAVSLRLSRAKRRLADELARQVHGDAGHRGVKHTGDHGS
jgi:RNA polymerase sigma-70 factor (ECF subfamily)